MQTLKIIALPLCFFLFSGFLIVGNSGILCVGADGHVELETECLPCCSVFEDDCETTISQDIHNEHDACHSCSDLALDGPLWSNRPSKARLVQSATISSQVSGNATCLFVYVNHENSYWDQSHLTFALHPPSLSITTTMLRC